MRPLTGSTPVWVAVRILVGERCDTFFALLERAGGDSGPMVIHDLRVASRRLREALTLFAPCYPTGAVEPLRRKTRRLTRALGELRNADEAFLFLSRLAPQLDPSCRQFLSAPLARCRQRRREERERLGPLLTSWQNGESAPRFCRAAGRPTLYAGGDHPAFLPVADFTRVALDPKESEIPHLLSPALREENVDAQHRLRIAVKHLRYRAEILSPLFRPGFRAHHATLKTYQEELGRMHDLDVFASLLVDEEAGPGREATLAALAEQRREHFRRFAALHERTPLPDLAEALRSLL